MNLNYIGVQCEWGKMAIWDLRAKNIRALCTAEALGFVSDADM